MAIVVDTLVLSEDPSLSVVQQHIANSQYLRANDPDICSHFHDGYLLTLYVYPALLVLFVISDPLSKAFIMTYNDLQNDPIT